MIGKSRHIFFEVLEPRILLSADGLLNVILPDQDQDTLPDGIQQVVQNAELLDTQEQVEEQNNLELTQSDKTNTHDCQPLLTIYVDDDNTNGEPVNVDLSVNNIGSAQIGEVLAVLSNDSDGNVESKVSTTEDGSMPVYENDTNLSKEYATSIEIRGPPANETVALSGMHLVDPTTDFDGQIVYLNFNGAQDVTYNGPVVVEGINIPEFSADTAGLAGQESAIISHILTALEQQFEGTGALFTTTEPDPDTSYSTVFVGGNNSAFSHLGDFYGVAEQVDIGNENPSDKAFVFPDAIPGIAADVDQYVTCLAQLIAHETGRLLGFAEADELVERGKPQIMADVNLSFVEVQVDGVRSTSTSDDFYPQQGNTIWIYSKFTHIYTGNGGINITLDNLDDSTAWVRGWSWDGDGTSEYYHETEPAPNDKVWHKDGYQITAYDPMVEGYETNWWEGSRTLGVWVYLGSETSFDLLTRAWVSGTFVPSSSSNTDQQGYYTYKWDIFPKPPDDSYEENDTLATAYDLSSQEQTWLSNIAGLGVQADDDWYKIDVTSGYERVLVDCRFTDSQGDIDIALYNTSGTRLASSTSTTDNEYIDYIVPSGGTYYVKVYYGDAGNTYDLWWDDIQRPNTLPDAPSFVSVPPSELYPTKTYTVTARYTDPDGRDDLQHVYLRLAQGDNLDSYRQTLMHTIDTNWTGQWDDEVHHLYDLSVSKTAITNGYEVTWAFKINWSWNESTNVDFYAWSYDDYGLESTRTKYDRNADYENDLVITLSIEYNDPVTLGETYRVSGYVAFEGGSVFPDDWSGISVRMDDGSVGGTNVAVDTSVSGSGYELTWTPTTADVGPHTLYVYVSNTNHQPPNNSDIYYDTESMSVQAFVITGKVTYRDVNGQTENARYIWVEAWESQVLLDYKIAEGYTNAEGIFRFTHDTVGDPLGIQDPGLGESGTRDIYFKIRAQNEAAKVSYEWLGSILGMVYWHDSSVAYDRSGPSYTRDFPFVSTGATPNHAAAWGIPGYVRDARDWLIGQVSWSRSQVAVLYPNTNWPQYKGFWPIYDTIFLPENWQNWGESTVAHEYGHAVHYIARNGSLPSGTGPSPHFIDSESSEGFALKEGWAEFFQCAVFDNAGIWSLEQNDYWMGQDGDGTDNFGNIVEGAIASIFWDLLDGAGDDSVIGFFYRLWNVFLNDDPNTIWNDAGSNDFYNYWNNMYGQTRPVDEIFIDHGVPVTDDPYDPNDTSASAYTFSNLYTTYSDLILSDTADWYKFTALETIQGGSSISLIGFMHNRGDIDLFVYDSSLNLIGQSEGFTDEETVDISGRPAGTYYVKVIGKSGDFSPDYDLVLHINKAPVISGLPNRSLNEDTSLNNTIDLWNYASDNETSDGGLTFSIVGNTNPNCGVSIDGNRYIDISPVTDWYGMSDVTIQVSDGYLTDTDTFRITVNSINDPPDISGLPNRSLNEDGSLNNTIDLWVYAWDVETADSGLMFNIVGNTNPNCGVSIDGNRYIDISPVADWYGTSDVTIRVSDGSLTDTDTFRITVISVNDAPIAQIDNISPNPAGRPGQLISFNGTGTDVDGFVTEWKWTSNLDGLLSTAEDFTAMSDNLTVGTHQISFEVRDNNNLWSVPATRDLTIFIIDTIAPTADLIVSDIIVGGNSTHTFTVTYSDNVAVDVSDLDNSDILVTGPNGFNQQATFIDVDINNDGSPRIATYQISAPGGTWDYNDNGTYTVNMQPNQVSDTANPPNYVAAGVLGLFQVDIADTIVPTADLSHPTDGESIVVSVINGSERYIDVTFRDTGGSGLDLSTIIDSGEEFTLGGSAASGVVVDGLPTLQSGTTYRYSFTGDFGLGPVDVNFIAGSWADNAGNPNAAEIESFTVSLFGSQQVISTQADNAESVYACDLDGDGDNDVLSASPGDDKIAWYENLGSGAFGIQHVISTQVDYPKSVYACDLDGDGDNDVLSASATDDKIAWYENLGGGAFGSQQVISTEADGASSIYACDLDGDGDNDVLSASSSDDKIAWYENLGGGNFGDPVTNQRIISTDASSAWSVYACDLNGDGDNDVLSASTGDDKIAWYENLGSGTFGSQQVISTHADWASSAYACDLDGDGDNDVLSASWLDNKIAWYENIGEGVFGIQQVISTQAGGARSVYACDLDGDRDNDVLSASAFDDKIAWYENLGGGAFGIQHVISTQADYARSVYACDLNGDGDNDVLSASIDDDKIAWYENLRSAPGSPEIDVEINGTDNVHTHIFGTVSIGQSISQDFTVRNEGDVDLVVTQAAGLVSPFTINPGHAQPANRSESTDDWVIPAGEIQTFTVSFSPDIPGDFSDTLVLTCNDSDEGSYLIVFAGTVTPYVDLQVSKSDTPDPVIAGSGVGNLTHTVTVINIGPSDATGITVLEDLTLPAGVLVDSVVPSSGIYTMTAAPDGTWTLDLAAGVSATLTVTLTVDSSTVDGATIRNTATVTSVNETDTNAGNDSATEDTTVQRAVDIQVSKTDTPDPVTAGSGMGNLTHTVTVTNAGPSDASGVVLSESVSLPAGTSIVSITPSGTTTYAPANISPGIWTVGNLTSGDSETLTIVMTVGSSTTNGAIVSDTATVTAVNETDTNPANDSATESTSVVQIDIIFVDDDATAGANNGLSWNDAFIYLQDALDFADSSGGLVSEICVAEGIYKPDQGAAVVSGDRSATFQLLNGVSVMGGYAGLGAPDPNARDVELYETILSGDLNGNDEPDFVNYDENSYHVVTCSGTDTTAVLSGFTITSGNANGPDVFAEQSGGGMNISGSSPTIVDSTFRGNIALQGSGMFVYSSNPILTNCTFINNFAVYGGGMYNHTNSSPILTDCTFNGNYAGEFGGAMINIENSNPTLTNTVFSSNYANYGGGMTNYLSSSPDLTNCTFNGNFVAYYGAGMYNQMSSPVLTGCTFSGNSAAYYGAGMFNQTQSSPVLTNCIFNGNYAGEYGGGLLNYENSNPTLTNTVFSGNYANCGGGMTNYSSSSPELTNCTFSGNGAAYYGAGMYNQTSSPVLTYCTFSENSATYHGGGMFNQTQSSPVLTNCIFNGNYVGEYGGGLLNYENSSPTLTNTLFSGNTANYGGGMANYLGSDPKLTNSTFSGNFATYYGGGIVNFDSNPTITNSIFWLNADSGGTNESSQIYGGTPFVNYSCIQGWSGSFGGTGNIGDDPMFVRNPDDGGDGWGVGGNDDYGDLRLSPGSPCIDAGDNTAVPLDVYDIDGDSNTSERMPLDLDLISRFIDDLLTVDTGLPDLPDYPYIVDMGAYEYNP